MDNMHLIDYLFAAIGGLLSAGWLVLFFALRRNADGVKENAQLVLEEKDKSAALVLNERDKLANQFRAEHKDMEEKFTEFRIMIAREYATTTLVEKIMLPMSKKLDEIEALLSTKLDRREFERHEARQNGNGHKDN